MKLGSLKDGGRDGALFVADKAVKKAITVPHIAATLQQALEDWSAAEEPLRKVSASLNAGQVEGSFAIDSDALASPLPRAYQFLDGSAYLAHVERVRKARGAEMPASFLTDPLMYQAVSDGFLGPTEPVPVGSEEFGIDFESEVGVIVDEVPMGIAAGNVEPHIKLIVLINDVSLRNLIPAELGKGFGFMAGKPRSTLSPVAVSPDELGDAWHGGKVHRPLVTHLNDGLFGEPECGVDMQFSFAELVAHAAQTRPLAAGTLIGSGTIANHDLSKGSSCLAERRVLEVISDGAAKTSFMAYGDRVRIEMFDAAGDTIFGAIDQVIEQYKGP